MFTELEQLMMDIKNYESRPIRLPKLMEELNQKYSVTLRNSDSQADNNKVEQSTTAEELVSKIEDIMAEFACTISFAPLEIVRQSIQLEKFKPRLETLLKTHRNTVSTAVNKQDDKYSSRGETESKIAFKNSLRHHVGKLVTADQELDQIVENIVEFFLDTVNPVFRALNDSDEQSVIK